MPKILEQSENESPSEVHQTGPANGESKTTRKEVGGGRPGVNFASGLLENSNLKQPRKFVDFLISLAGQTAFVILLILLPLCYTQAFNPPEFERMMLIMPPPPPPPPLVREIVKPKASLFQNGKLFAPRTVPKHIEIVKEAPEETPGSAGVAGGVPGGVPGGTLGGVLGGILSPGNQPVLPPPPPSWCRPRSPPCGSGNTGRPC
jgi:periplasmic protein TonB